MPWVVVALLAPYLAAAWLNSRWWTRKAPDAVEIAPGLLLGRAARDARGIASMVDLTAELPVDTAGVAYRCVPMLDLVVPTVEQIECAVQAVQRFDERRPTLVCCALGYSRSAAVVAAWLVASGKAASVKEAIGQVRARQPRIVLGSGDTARLQEWACQRGAA